MSTCAMQVLTRQMNFGEWFTYSFYLSFSPFNSCTKSKPSTQISRRPIRRLKKIWFLRETKLERKKIAEHLSTTLIRFLCSYEPSESPLFHLCSVPLSGLLAIYYSWASPRRHDRRWRSDSIWQTPSARFKDKVREIIHVIINQEELFSISNKLLHSAYGDNEFPAA